MVLFFKIIGCIIAFLLLFWVCFLWLYQKQVGFRFVIDKRKRNYNSLEKFLDSFYGSFYKKTHELIFRNQFKDMELCIKCKEEKESIKLTEMENQQSKLNQHIIVEYYISNRKSWRNLCGREGYVFKCSKHNIEVYNMVICMN
jgi:hypothetical protein